MPMKSAITISLTIHEFVFIQLGAFGRNACARLPITTTSSAGIASRSKVSATKPSACHQGSPSRAILVPAVTDVRMSVGNTPSKRKPSLNENLGWAS